MFIKFNTAVIIRVNRDLHDTHATDTINPRDIEINTTNIVSIQRTNSISLVIHTNATITKFNEFPKFPLTEDYYPAPLTYTVEFNSEAERDRIFNKLLHNEL